MTKGENRIRGPGSAFDAVVLAGERSRDSELLKRFGVPAKALIQMAGRPMIVRVIGALFQSGLVERIFLCGQSMELFRKIPEIGTEMDSGKIIWIQNEKGPSLSALKAMEAAGGKRPILLTTSDHALLRPIHVRFFCKRALSLHVDLAVGLARLEGLKVYPGVKRTYYRFKDGKFCTCNLFGFLTRNSFKAARFWQEVESKRKNPLKVVASFGITWAIRYLLGWLSLEEAIMRASKILGCTLGAVILDFPEAAIDVDTINDLELAQRILENKTLNQPGTGSVFPQSH